VRQLVQSRTQNGEREKKSLFENLKKVEFQNPNEEKLQDKF
jgi:hypothetical protein